MPKMLVHKQDNLRRLTITSFSLWKLGQVESFAIPIVIK